MAFGWLILLAFGATVVLGIHHMVDTWSWTAAMLSVLGTLIWRSSKVRDARFQLLASSRVAESICGFVRSFDRRPTDPVLLRAVYETIQEQIGVPTLPIRLSDRFVEDLDLDDDDLDEIAVEAASLANRSTEASENNPLYGRVTTVRELIEFLECQPLLTAKN